MELVEENLDEHHLDEKEVVDVVVRFAGDSGDGMQLTGNNFTEATALYGNDLSTFPDFPAEIRAPVGATFGVSGHSAELMQLYVYYKNKSLSF